jgi:hypothetical protein
MNTVHGDGTCKLWASLILLFATNVKWRMSPPTIVVVNDQLWLGTAHLEVTDTSKISMKQVPATALRSPFEGTHNGPVCLG